MDIAMDIAPVDIGLEDTALADIAPAVDIGRPDTASGRGWGTARSTSK